MVEKSEGAVVKVDPNVATQEVIKTTAVAEASIEEIDDDFDMDFFVTEASDIKSREVVEESFGDKNLYAPNVEHEKAVNREYKATIRFVKNPRSNKKNNLPSIVSKYVVWLPNPNNLDSKIMVDDYSNFADGKNNIITNAFFELYKSKNLALVSLAQNNFSRKLYNFSLVQIINDLQQPELADSVKVFRFATQVNDLIDAALVSDEKNEIYAKMYSCPMGGHKFIMQIDEKQVEKKDGTKITITNYDNSRFGDKASPIDFPTSGIAEDWHKTADGMKEMITYLRANSPVLEDYQAKKWTKEQEDDIIESVRLTINNAGLFDKIYIKTYGTSYYSGGERGDATEVETDEIPESGVAANFEEESQLGDSADIDDIKL